MLLYADRSCDEQILLYIFCINATEYFEKAPNDFLTDSRAACFLRKCLKSAQMGEKESFRRLLML